MQLTNKHPKYTFIKDVYYFSKTVPYDLRNHYNKPRIVQSLRTKSCNLIDCAKVNSVSVSVTTKGQSPLLIRCQPDLSI